MNPLIHSNTARWWGVRPVVLRGGIADLHAVLKATIISNDR
jgi:hypothetical protein